jgi:hypothetical protein
MFSHALDLVVHETELLRGMRSVKSEIFLEFRLDGPAQCLVSPPKWPFPCVTWEFPIRFILQVTDFSNKFVYVSVVTNDPPGTKVNLGRAKFSLKSFPIAHPKRFMCPLMDPSTKAMCVAKMSLTAILSAMVPHRFSAGGNRQDHLPKPKSPVYASAPI